MGSKMQFHHPTTGNGHLIFDFERKESVFPLPNSDPVQNYSLNFKNLKEENLAWDSRIPATRRLVRPMFQVILETRRLVQTLSAFIPAKYPSSRKEPTERKWKVIPAYSSSGGALSTGLQNGYKNGASLRSRQTTT